MLGNPMRRHPFIDLFRDRPLRTLWTGLVFSALGDQVQAIAIIWLAIEVAGPGAGFVPAANYAVVLLTGLLAGAFIDRLPVRASMIALDLARAVVVFVPVLLAMTVGLSLFALVASMMLLSALHAVFSPLFYACLPHLARTPDRIQATNGLVDATVRLSRLGGPFIAGIAATVVPTVHLLTFDALTFLVSAAALWRLGPALDRPRDAGAPASALSRMLHGFTVARREKAVRWLLIGNSVTLAAWALGLTLGLSLLVAENPVGDLGLAAAGFLLGAYGAGDLSSNVVVSAVRFRRRWQPMMLGYVVMGLGLAGIPLAFTLLPAPIALAGAMLVAFIAGTGGPIFFLPMQTYFQTHLAGIDLAGILRLRVSLIAGSMMLGTLIGPFAFAGVGAVATVVACGLVIATVGAVGLVAVSRQPGAAI